MHYNAYHSRYLAQYALSLSPTLSRAVAFLRSVRYEKASNAPRSVRVDERTIENHGASNQKLHLFSSLKTRHLKKAVHGNLFR